MNSLQSIDPPTQKRKRANGGKAQEEKRRKWEAKQAKQGLQLEIKSTRAQWIKDNHAFATWVSEEDTTAFGKQDTKSSPLHQLLLPYEDIQDSRKKFTFQGDGDVRLFIAEGTETIRLLIQQSIQERGNGVKPISLKSVFVKPSILFEEPVNLLRDIQQVIQHRGDNCPGFSVLVGPEAALSKVAGFQVSRGAMACGVVPKDCDEAWLERLVEQRMSDEGSKKIRLLALDGICDTANLGSMIRCASAFGIHAVILSNDCCDPWYRRSVRVSMGHIFKVPVVRVGNLAGLLLTWKARYPALHSFAAVIDTELLLSEHGSVKSSWCCVMGNEANGISKAVADGCTQRLRIQMEHGVDSLSVPIACGILLHGLREREENSMEINRKES
jgi:tRNA G18 (ribose-2'-O)-methylase SpoU